MNILLGTDGDPSSRTKKQKHIEFSFVESACLNISLGCLLELTHGIDMIRRFSTLISTTQERIKIDNMSKNNHHNKRRPSTSFSSLSTSTTMTTVSSETMVSPSSTQTPSNPLDHATSPTTQEISSTVPTPQPRPISSLLQFRNHRKIQKMLRQVDKHPNPTIKDNNNNNNNSNHTNSSNINHTNITSSSNTLPTKNDHKSKHVFSTDQRRNGNDRENDRHELFSERTKARPSTSTSTRASGSNERVEVVIETITTARFQSFVLHLHLGKDVTLLKAKA